MSCHDPNSFVMSNSHSAGEISQFEDDWDVTLTKLLFDWLVVFESYMSEYVGRGPHVPTVCSRKSDSNAIK